MNTQMLQASVTMGQLQHKLDTISHNMANLNTHGFKRREASFSDLLFQQLNNNLVTEREVGRLTPNGLRVGSGARVGQFALRVEQGPLQKTDRALDVALVEAKQYFQIQGDDGEVRYTKNGAFYLSPIPNNEEQLNLVNGDGHFVVGANGPITIPATFKEIAIREDGVINVTDYDNTQQAVGQLQLVEVELPQMLQQVGDNQYMLPNNLAELGYNEADILGVIAQENVNVKQYYLEGSNVDMAQEMTELMATQRAYQFNAASVSMADQMMGLVNTIR